MGKFSHTDGVGIIWFQREEYARYLTLVADPQNVISSYDEWEKRAHETIAFIEREGGKPIRVETSVDKLVTYCAMRGLQLDAHGRNMFAADPANWPARSKN